MKRLPSRFRRMDGALADLPLDEPMLLTELDGLLTGVLVAPQVLTPEDWLPVVWGDETDGVPPFEDPLDVQWFRSAVIARRDEIARDLARGRLRPILDTDERSGDVLWEPWIDGFAAAIELRPGGWEAVCNGDNAEVADAWSRLFELVAIASFYIDIDTTEINTLDESAPASVLRLHAARADTAAGAARVSGSTPDQLGRNELCRCGSGRKAKRCCTSAL